MLDEGGNQAELGHYFDSFGGTAADTASELWG